MSYRSCIFPPSPPPPPPPPILSCAAIISHRCRYGYSAECRRISSAVGRLCPLHRASLDIFEWLPVAAVVSGAVLVLHGGIGDGLWSLEQLRAARRPINDDILDDESSNHILANVLWSDPIDGDETLNQNRATQVTRATLPEHNELSRDPGLLTFFHRSPASAAGTS